MAASRGRRVRPAFALSVTGAAVLLLVGGTSAAGNGARLRVAVEGGPGRVTSSTGLACLHRCSTSVPSGTVVTLRAFSVDGSYFEGWGGACSGDVQRCVLYVDRDAAAIARFQPEYDDLDVSVGGGGRVTSEPRGISCGAGADGCSAQFVKHTRVRLTAHATPETRFDRWQGACSGRGACTIPLDRRRLALAVFRRLYDVSTSVTGNGAVTSPLWPTCSGTSCSGRSPSDALVSLHAVPAQGSVFTGWSGACTGSSPDCVVASDDDVSAVASFAPSVAPAPRLAVTVSGPGKVVGGGSAGPVTLTAVPDRRGVFAGWGGACSGKAPQCTLSVDAARSVTAAFRRVYPLTIHGGRTPISVAPFGLVCSRTCLSAVSSDRVVTMSIPGASSPEISVSARWYHLCAGNSVTCAIAVDAPTDVRVAVGLAAPVSSQSFGLVVSLTARGVVNGPYGFHCARTTRPVACSTSFSATSSVRLTATPKKRFVRWAGSCTGTKPACTLTMNETKTVIAYLRAP